jgi:serine/threonine protein phosphatase PrpC
MLSWYISSVKGIIMSAFEAIEQINEIVVGDEPQQQSNERISFINGTTRALGKGQDFVVFGKGSGFEWGVLLDGHGSDIYIDLLRSLDWQSIMTSENPWKTLHEIIHAAPFIDLKYTGSTLLMLRAYSDRLETLSVGDSGLAIYKNGALVYKSTEHNSKNESEKERLKSRNVRFEEYRKVPFMVSSTSMRMKTPDYTQFENGEIFAPTQALGHCNITGYAPETHTEYFASEDEMRCVLYSDGFGDMFLFEADEEEERLKDERDILTMTAEELANKAEARWIQMWKVYYVEHIPDMFVMTTFDSTSRDDVGVLVWDNRKDV